MKIRPPPWRWRRTHIRVFPLLRFLPGKWYMLDTIEPASLLPDGSFYLAQKKLKIGVEAEGKLTLQRGKYHDRTKGFAAASVVFVSQPPSNDNTAASMALAANSHPGFSFAPFPPGQMVHAGHVRASLASP